MRTASLVAARERRTGSSSGWPSAVTGCSDRSSRFACSLCRGGRSVARSPSAPSTRLLRRSKLEPDGGRGYGDFQFAIDPASDDFLKEGICSCYVAVTDETPIPESSGRSPARLGGVVLALARRSPPRLRCLYTALPGHRRADLLVGPSPDGGLPRRIPRALDQRLRVDVTRLGDDHGVLRAARRAAGVHGRGGAGLPGASEHR